MAPRFDLNTIIIIEPIKEAIVQGFIYLVRLKNLWVKSVKICGHKFKKLLTNGIISGMLGLVTGMSPIWSA